MKHGDHGHALNMKTNGSPKAMSTGTENRNVMILARRYRCLQPVTLSAKKSRPDEAVWSQGAPRLFLNAIVDILQWLGSLDYRTLPRTMHVDLVLSGMCYQFLYLTIFICVYEHG
ncbi:hypothetical protein P170DRAFT_428444 [Aspergillus steynii IBT 23096]|uniref:Uncharacterized protein n=1 Tax=Aspergillus steynii IBT 23096 TaxID=1392250 RepID=A0A2I2G2Y7_9EURO|nr:uncharacterized protein P170DRAFT_428444 [Aspergillus steynii IBT 23096]PLB47238.1 hypothetical protein P170DRAFT_428444 [Aspergillus steynii IBT 23096]